MKKLLLVASVMLATAAALAQGTLNFSNFAPPGVNAPVTYSDTGAKVGPEILGQLYVGASADSLAPIGSPVAFSKNASTGLGTGLIIAGAVTVPGIAGDSPAFVQLKAWEAAKGADFAAAAAAGGYTGTSGVFNIAKLGGAGTPPSTPANLVGLTSFTVSAGAIIPEPSTIALGLLGAAALLIRRRS